MLNAFLNALENGSTDQLTGLLADTVQFQSDGGGKATAIRRVLVGRETVGKYVARILGRLWTRERMEILDINGLRGAVFYHGPDIAVALAFGYDENGRIDRVYNIRNPEKLSRLATPLRHDPRSGGLWQ